MRILWWPCFVRNMLIQGPYRVFPVCGTDRLLAYSRTQGRKLAMLDMVWQISCNWKAIHNIHIFFRPNERNNRILETYPKTEKGNGSNVKIFEKAEFSLFPAKIKTFTHEVGSYCNRAKHSMHLYMYSLDVLGEQGIRTENLGSWGVLSSELKLLKRMHHWLRKYMKPPEKI